MNKLDEMWAALLAYLPQAIDDGHGDSWAKMCNEKTPDAAYAASDAAASDAWAASAAYAADAAAYGASYADHWAQKAIDALQK
jgi:hypothetical protein